MGLDLDGLFEWSCMCGLPISRQRSALKDEFYWVANHDQPLLFPAGNVFCAEVAAIHAACEEGSGHYSPFGIRGLVSLVYLLHVSHTADRPSAKFFF